YWPSFSSLSPEARGAYVSWLASDRSDPSCPIGYVNMRANVLRMHI
ncbi:TerB N-terminal domain-containing protein, partial [Klebsiella pneumoniae]